MSLYEQYQSEQNTIKTDGSTSGASSGGGSLFAQFQASQKGATQTPAPEPSVYEKIKNGVSSYADDSAKTVTTFGNSILHPLDALGKAYNAIKTPFLQGGQDIYDSLDKLINGKTTTADKVADVSKIISGAATTLFSPITGAFNIAENVPGAKQVADTLNLVPKALGFAGSFATGKVIDVIPDSVISPESKAIIKQPLQDLGSLAAQVLLGGKIMDKISEYNKKGTEITPDVAHKIVVESQSEVHNIPIETAQSKYQQYLKSNGYEPYIPHEQLPTIEMGNKPKPTMPVIDFNDTSKPSTGSYKYEPITGKENPFITSAYDHYKSENYTDLANHPENIGRAEALATQEKPTNVDRTNIANGSPEELRQPLNTTEGTGDTKVRGLSQGVESKAVENSLASNFGDLPEYKSVSMKDQAEKATQIVNTDYDQAKRIALGNEKPPSGVLPESLFVAVEKRATAEGDINTLRDLATKSKLATDATTMGQRIRTLAERDPESPTGAIRDVVKSREEKAVKSLKKGETLESSKKKIAGDIKNEIKKLTPKKQDWNSFIESIQC